MSKTTKYPALKAEIKKRQEHSQQVLRFAIQNSIELERDHAWNEKREYGKDTRNLLLVYAFLRNVPYHVVERSSNMGLVSLASEAFQYFKQNFPELWDSLPEEASTRLTFQAFKDWMVHGRRAQVTQALDEFITEAAHQIVAEQEVAS